MATLLIRFRGAHYQQEALAAEAYRGFPPSSCPGSMRHAA